MGRSTAEEPTRDLRLPAAGGPSAGRVALVAVGAVVGLVFLALAGVGLYALLGSGGGGAAPAVMSTGECVAVSADGRSAAVAAATCGSPAANFVVVGVVDSGVDCPKDVNLSYALDGARTACLDVDWRAGDCFELSGDYPHRVDCTAPVGRHTVRVAEIDRTTSETAKCPTGSGLSYPARGFVVCLSAP